ncbi:MAG: SIMPL domain-containing protein [Neomegalonema sp.]|nr:SIMPL domain-containing protein [Neomegalonema sp.]
MNNWGQLVGGVAIAAGIAFGGVTLGSSLIDMQRASRTVVVKGLAQKEVEADLASWRVPFRGEATTSAAALAAAEKGRKELAKFLADGGIAADEVTFEPYSLKIQRSVLQEGGVQREVIRYIAVGAVRVRTTKVDAIAKLSGETRKLLDADVLLGDSDFANAARPEFLYTKLNSVKPSLIEAATKAARASAKQFAKDSGATVGDIATANQGVIQILPRDGQYNERQERYKVIRVVTTVRYYLND